MTRETQATIGKWVREFIGTRGNHFTRLFRAQAEMTELLAETYNETLKPEYSSERARDIVGEAADVAICMMWFAEMEGMVVNLRHDIDVNEIAQITNASSAVAANLLLAKLQSAYMAHSWPDRHTVEVDMAWMMIHLDHICHRLGSALQLAIDAKMAVNRKRTWHRDSNGNGYHCKIAGSPKFAIPYRADVVPPGRAFSLAEIREAVAKAKPTIRVNVESEDFSGMTAATADAFLVANAHHTGGHA